MEIEKKRVYCIADHLELWKKLLIKNGGYLSLEELKKDPRNINITRIHRKEGLLLKNEEDIFYVMFYSSLNKQRKNCLKKYFSEIVLSNYFYIITDKDGKIKEMFWDKP